ncbi:MAG: ferritin family protein [Deferrisomatales bacterium]|nr:ferritin family protein [Deferrisomatales bacterium]
MLGSHGFEAYSLDGGMDAWNGLVSRAEVDQGKWLLDGGETPEEALDLALALEADSLDLYLRLAREVQASGAKAVFLEIAEEEKAHLRRLGDLRGRGTVSPPPAGGAGRTG